MQPSARKIAYSATFTAVSVVAIVASRYLPVTLTALLVCSVCYFLCLIRCGIGYGLLCITASLVASFILGGVGTVFLLDAVIFAPYSLLAYFIKKLRYLGKTAVIRAGIIVIFANIVFALTYYLLASHISYNFSVMGERFGYAVLAVMVSGFALVTDYLFFQATEYFLKRFR